MSWMMTLVADTKERCDVFWVHQRITIVSSAIIGFICNLYIFTNRLPHFDGILGMGPGGGPVIQGRWFMGALGWLRYRCIGDYSEPVFNGIVTVCFIAIAAGYVTAALRLRGIGAVMAGALMQVFPVIACTYLFMFTVEYYALAICLSSAGAYLLVSLAEMKGWRLLLRCGIAAVLIMNGLGIYQAYFPYTVTVILMGIISRGIIENEKCTMLLKQMVCSVISLLAAMLGYFFAMHGVASLAGVSVLDWHGQKIGVISISDVPMLIIKTYRYLWEFYRYGKWGLSEVLFIRIIACILAILTIAWLLQNIINKILVHQIGEAVLLLLCIIALPVAVNLIYVMVPDDASGIGIHILMLYSVVLLFIFPLAISERPVWGSMVGKLAVCAAIIATVYYADFTNKVYTYFDYTIQSAKSYYTVLVSRIKGSEGYDPNYHISYIGDVKDASVFDLSNYFEILQDISTLRSDRNFAIDNRSYREGLMMLYCGFYMEPEDDDVMYEKHWDEIDAMPDYPKSGSIKVIDDCVVVKLSGVGR